MATADSGTVMREQPDRKGDKKGRTIIWSRTQRYRAEGEADIGNSSHHLRVRQLSETLLATSSNGKEDQAAPEDEALGFSIAWSHCHFLGPAAFQVNSASRNDRIGLRANV